MSMDIPSLSRCELEDANAFFTEHEAEHLQTIYHSVQKAASRRKEQKARLVLIAASALAACIVAVMFMKPEWSFSQLLQRSVMDRIGSSMDVIPHDSQRTIIPPEWAGSFYPVYVPQNVSFVGSFTASSQCVALYGASTDKAVTYSFCKRLSPLSGSHFAGSIAIVKTVHDQPASVFVQDHHICIQWQEEGVNFSLSLTGQSIEDALLYASSVEKVK